MEQNFQKQTSRHHSYHMRRVLGTSGQDHCCVLCLADKLAPLTETEITQLTQLIQQYNAPLKAYYYIAKSLSHYGNVDQLAPAGAMEEFVDYVHGLEQDEATAFFESFKELVKQGQAEIQVIRGEYEWKKTLQYLKEHFTEIHLLASQDV